MKSVTLSLLLTFGLIGWAMCIEGQLATNYDALISEGNGFLKDGKLKEAYQDALSAAAQEPKRFEAYALTAFVLHRQGSFAKAKEILDEALSRAPADKRDALAQFQKKLVADAESVTKAPTQSPPQRETVSSPDRRSLEVLKLILEDADKAKSAGERSKFLDEFLEKSEAFLKENPTATNLWMLRARVAVDLGKAKEGWEAGQQLKKLGADKSESEEMIQTLAKLDRKGWLADRLEAVKPEAAPENPKLFPAQQNGKWGFIDVTGKLIIPLKFEHADVFSEGLAAAKLNDKYGYIDASGEFVIQPKYDAAFRFSDGLARVVWGVGMQDIALEFFNPTSYFEEDCVGTRLPIIPGLERGSWISTGGDGGEWTYIDRRGKEVFGKRFSNCTDFSDGLATVKVSDKMGIIDKDGKFILEPKYATIHRFFEGLAVFSMQTGTKQEDGKEVPVFKQGYLDKQGNEAVEAKFDYALRFSEGLACVLTGGFSSGSYGYIDKTGALVIPAQFANGDTFSEGIAWVVVRGNFVSRFWVTGKSTQEKTAVAFIDKTGKFVIQPDTKFLPFGSKRPFTSGLAAVQMSMPHVDSKGRPGNTYNWTFIDRQGEVVIPAIFDGVPFGFRNGLALVRAGGEETEDGRDRVGWTEGYINLHGRPIWGVTEEHFSKEMNRVKSILVNRPDKKAWDEHMKKILSGRE